MPPRTQLHHTDTTVEPTGTPINWGGGSNYTFADGSVRYLKFGRSMWPINLWAVTPEYRDVGIQ